MYFSSFYNSRKEQVSEAIALKYAKKQKMSRNNSDGYKIDIINDIFQGKDRLVYDIDIPENDVKKNDVDDVVKRHVDTVLRNEYNTQPLDEKDYIKGVAYSKKDEKRKQPNRIGKLLRKLTVKYGKKDMDTPHGKINPAGLLADFEKDPLRGTVSGKHKLIISRHPYDIAGMSTDRHWKSCLHLGYDHIVYPDKSSKEGVNKKYTMKHAFGGSLVAYIVSPKDIHENKKLAIRRPYSRIIMNPYLNIDDPNDYAYSVGRIYGVPFNSFKKFLIKWVSENINMNADKGDHKYILKAGLYRDGLDVVTPNFSEYGHSSTIAIDVFNSLINDNNDPKLIEQGLIRGKAAEMFLELGMDQVDVQFIFEIPSDVEMPNAETYTYENEHKWPQFVSEIIDALHLNETIFAHIVVEKLVIDTTQDVVNITLNVTNTNINNTQLMTTDDMQDYWKKVFTDVDMDKFSYVKTKKEIIKILNTTQDTDMYTADNLEMDLVYLQNNTDYINYENMLEQEKLNAKQTMVSLWDVITNYDLADISYNRSDVNSEFNKSLIFIENYMIALNYIRYQLDMVTAPYFEKSKDPDIQSYYEQYVKENIPYMSIYKTLSNISKTLQSRLKANPDQVDNNLVELNDLIIGML